MKNITAAADVIERASEARLPEASVEQVGERLKIRIEGIRKDMLLDQGSDVQVDAGQGCITNPGGPNC